VTRIHHGLDLNGPSGLGSGSTDKASVVPSQSTSTQLPAQPGVTPTTSEVEITPTAQLLASLEQQIASQPSVDQSRVDAIRQALGSGTYRIDSSRVADGLLAAHRFDAQAAKPATTGNAAKAFTDTAQLGSDGSG
jgi:negative regulator of flagellin synthesis FlgM